MKRMYQSVLMILVVAIAATQYAGAQAVLPGGINYQAVARDNNGDELVNTDIEVRFSIITGSPTGPVVYQEVFTGDYYIEVWCFLAYDRQGRSCPGYLCRDKLVNCQPLSQG